VDRTTEFAKSVVSKKPVDGRTIYGLNETLCCKRHLDDLKKQGTDDFPYVYIPERSKYRIEFAECLTISEGKEKKQLKLFEFQAFIKGCQYGWVHKNTGFRRFRTSYVQVARQNGKSIDNAENTVFYSNFDDYIYPQIFCVATKEAQAKIVLKEAIKFIQTDEDLENEFKIQEYKSLIVAKRTMGEVQALGRDSKTMSGHRPYYASVDEYFAHPTNQMYKEMSDGAVFLDESLISVITTAGFDLNSPCKELYDYCVNVLLGNETDDTQFIYIADLDKEDDIWDDLNWQKANPLWNNLRLGNLKSSAIKAKVMGGNELRNFITKALNRWYQAADRQYLNLQKWRDCASDTGIEDMEGKDCYLGLDLSSGGDLTSGTLEFAVDFEGHTKYFIHSHSFMPTARLAEHVQADKAPYDVWVKEGLITLTETLGGYKTDYKYIISYYKELIEKHNLKLKGIAYDPHNASAFLQDLEEFNVDCVEIVQSCKSLNDATVDFKNTVDAQDVIYNKKDKLLIWSFTNAVTVSNSFGEIKIDKDLQNKRIDPCDATIDAHKLVLTIKAKQSIYESRGLRSLL
jgi:phage terminase large subunit-like protein